MRDSPGCRGPNGVLVEQPDKSHPKDTTLNAPQQPQPAETHDLKPAGAAGSPAPPTAERRASVRYVSDAAGFCHPGVVRQDRSWPVRVLDVSVSGVRLASPRLHALEGGESLASS